MYLKHTFFATILKVGIVVVETWIYLLIVLIFDVFIGYDVLPANLTVAFFKFFFTMCIWTPGVYRFYKLFGYGREHFSKLLKWAPLICAAVFIYCAAGMYFYNGICMCLMAKTTPGWDFGKLHTSTAWMRSRMESTCPAEYKPCMVYTTLPENALSEVFINFHVNLDSCEHRRCSPVFEYREISETEWSSEEVVKGEYRSLKSEYSQRNIFTVLLKELLPNSTYVFRINEPTWKNSTPQTFSYKTFDINNITIVDGGDIGNDLLAMKMNDNTVSKMNADLIMVGGDIAYDNNVPTCYRAWDYLLKRLPHQSIEPVTNSTRLIPLVFGPGNHDLGVNSYSEAEIIHSPHEPVFKHYFPQNTEDGKVPNLLARKSYFSQKIGDKILIVSLDVGYEASMEGEQKQWIEEKLSEPAPAIKIAQYHGPILTS